MRQIFAFLLVVVSVLTTGNALAATIDSEKTELLQISGPDVGSSLRGKHENTNKRFLRTVETTESDNEERASFGELKTSASKFATKILDFMANLNDKLAKMPREGKFKKWYKDGETPDTIFKKFGLSIGDPDLRKNPLYTEYSAFNTYWRNKKGSLANMYNWNSAYRNQRA